MRPFWQYIRVAIAEKEGYLPVSPGEITPFPITTCGHETLIVEFDPVASIYCMGVSFLTRFARNWWYAHFHVLRISFIVSELLYCRPVNTIH